MRVTCRDIMEGWIIGRRVDGQENGGGGGGWDFL